MISALEETSTNLIGSASKTASIARKATLLEDLTSQIKLQEELELRLRDAQSKEATEEEAELAALEQDPEIKELRAKLAQGLERNKKLQSSAPASNDIVDKGTQVDGTRLFKDMDGRTHWVYNQTKAAESSLTIIFTTRCCDPHRIRVGQSNSTPTGINHDPIAFRNALCTLSQETAMSPVQRSHVPNWNTLGGIVKLPAVTDPTLFSAFMRGSLGDQKHGLIFAHFVDFAFDEGNFNHLTIALRNYGKVAGCFPAADIW